MSRSTATVSGFALIVVGAALMWFGAPMLLHSVQSNTTVESSLHHDVIQLFSVAQHQSLIELVGLIAIAAAGFLLCRAIARCPDHKS